MTTPPQPKRLYQVWQGNNRFFCGGRLMFGPEVGSIFLLTSLIATPVVLFILQSMSRIQGHFLPIPALVVVVLVTMLDLIFLFLTSSRDPGIVPRNKKPIESEGLFNTVSPSMEWVSARTAQLRLPQARTLDVIVNGRTVKLKYCDTCFLYRPPRASHCSICNNCVQRFDHHCPWVGQCIGIRNYRFFFLFISSSTFLCIYVFIFSWVDILAYKDDNASVIEVMSKEALSVILIIYCLIAAWFIGGLTIFHVYLISTNQTTYENFRYRYDERENSHNKGVLRNFKELFFSRIPPSMNDFRSWVVEDHLTDAGAVSTKRWGDSIRYSRNKIDIEEGSSKLAIDDSLPASKILKNLDYNGLDDNLKNENENQDAAVVQVSLPIDQEFTDTSHETHNSATLDDNEPGDSDQGCSAAPYDHTLRNSNQCMMVENGAKVVDSAGEGNTSNGMTPISHNNRTCQV